MARAFAALPAGSLGNISQDQTRAFLVREGRGSRIFDYSGNEYIDYLLGSGPMVLGHAHPAVVEAVREAVGRGFTFYHDNGTAVELAEEIVRAVPCAEQVRFTTSGTDATFQALRVARAARGRDAVLKFEGGFHGMHDYSHISLSPRRDQLQAFPRGARTSGGIPQAVLDLVLVAPYNDIERTTAIIEQRHDDLAAVIVEPFQRILTPVQGFLQGLREVTHRFGIPLVFDEVVTGFRLAYGGAQAYYGVTPDLAALGKIVGGGFPLGAVVGRRDLMRHYDATQVDADAFIPQIGTLNGNPVAAAAGLATLAVLREPGAYDRLHATGRRLMLGLENALTEAEIPHYISGEPVNFDVYFTSHPVQDYRSGLDNDAALTAQFNRGLLDRGIYKPSQKFYIALAHTDDDIAQTILAFHETAHEMRRTRA